MVMASWSISRCDLLAYGLNATFQYHLCVTHIAVGQAERRVSFVEVATQVPANTSLGP
jgi:hypothetical protein